MAAATRRRVAVVATTRPPVVVAAATLRRRWRRPAAPAKPAAPIPPSVVTGRHGGQRRGHPGRRRLQVCRGEPWRGLRLLRADVVGVGPGRRLPAPPVGAAVRQRPARAVLGRSTGRPDLLLLADQPRRHLHRRRDDDRRRQPERRASDGPPSTGATSPASAARASASDDSGRCDRLRGRLDIRERVPRTVPAVVEGIDVEPVSRWLERPRRRGRRRRSPSSASAAGGRT